MKKLHLLKSALLLCALIVGSGSSWATDETLVFNTDAGLTAIGISKPSSGSGTNLGDNTYVQGDVSLSATNGSTETRVWNSSGTTSLRVYNGGTLTIEVPVSKDITSIVFTGTTNFTADGWNSSTKTWSGTANSVTFTNTSSGSTIQTIKVTYGDADPRTAVDINSLTFSASYVAVDGATVQATAGHNTPACTTATFTYESLDVDKATCTSAGIITAVANGTARIKATMSIPNDDPNYRVGTATKTVNIEVKKAFHTATFYVNGSSSSNSFEEDQAVTFPDDPSNLGGKTFVGWKKGAGIDGTTDVAPSFVTKATETMDDGDVDYYAVFALKSTEEGNVTKTIDKDTKNLPTGSYPAANTFVDKEFEGINFKIQQMYLNSGKLQWRAAGNANGTGTMYNTDALSKIQSVVLTYDSSDGSKNFTVEVGDAENPSGGTSITPTNDNLVYTFDCSSYNKSYFVLTNGSGAGYLTSIAITYKGSVTTYSGYCTSITVPVSTASGKNYGTYVTTYPLNFGAVSDDIKAYVAASEASAGKVTFTGKDAVPAGTPLLIKTTAAGATVNVPVVASADPVGTNKLVAGDGTAITYNAGEGHYYYILSSGTFRPANNSVVAEGKAYLSLTNAATANELTISFDDEENGDVTGIAEVNSKKAFAGEYFNLNGQRVNANHKGIVIVNGKKFLNK